MFLARANGRTAISLEFHNSWPLCDFATAARRAVVPILTALIPLILLTYWAATTGLQCDELLFLRAIQLGPLDGLAAVGSSHPPLVRWLVSPFCDSGMPDWWLRLPCVLASVATVFVWYALLNRVFRDRATVALLLGAMTLSGSWLAVGYQLVPYAFLTLFVSLHALSWFWLNDRKSWFRASVFVATGAGAAWSHFYGINVLIADQLVWLILIWRGSASWRLWLAMTATTILLTLPLLPLALFYMEVERPYSILQIDNFAHYFWWASGAMFCKMTFNQLALSWPFYLFWYGVAAVAWTSVLRVNRTNEDWADKQDSQLSFAVTVLLGIFVAGFPAMQAHALLSGKAMWERYAVHAAWVHWPLLVLLVQMQWGKLWARRMAGVALAICVIGATLGGALRPEWTFDDRPVVNHLRDRARPGDAFFAQDIDMWIGPANFDQLWYQRNAPANLPVITGPVMGRFELAKEGLPLHVAGPQIKRIWIYSSLHSEPFFRRERNDGWQLAELKAFGRNPPLALFVRSDS